MMKKALLKTMTPEQGGIGETFVIHHAHNWMHEYKALLKTRLSEQGGGDKSERDRIKKAPRDIVKLAEQ